MSLPLNLMPMVRPDLPPFVEQIILRSLAKRPEDRYQTGKELASALQEAISHAALHTMAPLLPASPVAPKSPPVTVPRIRVADLSGQTIQVVDVTRQGLIIGRQNDCDVVLSAETVSRRHLQVKWDGKRTMVTDLRSSYGTKMGNQKLVPQVSRVWEQQQTVTVGPFSLYLEMPEVPKVVEEKKPTQPQYSEQLPQVVPSLAHSSRIGVRVQPDKLSITPGQPAETRVTLVNLGKTVDWFSPFVEGVDPGWVQGQGQEVHLNPGMQKEVDLRVKVAKAPENLAQEYPVTIRVHSREKPGESEAAQALWTVLPFWDDRLKIEPGKTRGRGTGNYTVTVENNGNISERYELGCEDAEQKLTYQFRPGHEVRVEPGKQAKLPLKVKTRRFWLGTEQPHPFQIHATPAAKRSPQTRNAELVNRALIPGWLLPIVGTLLALALVLALLLPRGSQENVASTLTPTSIDVPTAAPTPGPTATPTPIPLPPGPNFTSFTDDSKSSMQLNGSATIGASVLELTPAQQFKAGSAYFNQAIDPNQSFHTQFQFFSHGQSDGIAFIVQSAGPTALGVEGGGLGYGGGKSGGISPSVAVEFDTVQNDGDPDNNHTGVTLNGDQTTYQSPGPKTVPFTLYGSPVNVWIDYDAPSQTLQISISQGSTRPSSPLLTSNVNIATLGKSAFVGFTGGTGSFAAAQDILSWQFSGGGFQ